MRITPPADPVMTTPPADIISWEDEQEDCEVLEKVEIALARRICRLLAVGTKAFATITCRQKTRKNDFILVLY